MSLRNEGVNDAARFRNLLPRLKSHLARADQPLEFCGTGVRHSVFGDLHVTEDASIAAPLKTYDSWLNYESPAHCNDKIRIQRTKGGELPSSWRKTLDPDDFPHLATESVCCRSDSIFYSFYQATDDRLNNVTSVLCGLLPMILNQKSSFLQLLRNSHEYSGAGKTFFQHVSSCDALGRMFEVDSAAANVYINHEEDKLRALRGYSLELSVTVISPLTQKTHSSRLLQFVISRLAFTEDTRRKSLHNHNSLWAHYEEILTNIRECLDADYESRDNFWTMRSLFHIPPEPMSHSASKQTPHQARFRRPYLRRPYLLRPHFLQRCLSLLPSELQRLSPKNSLPMTAAPRRTPGGLRIIAKAGFGEGDVITAAPRQPRSAKPGARVTEPE
ncbi:uncharacterized protein CCOS01_16418 [Colletotrichum costaricense]|uniref:Uncharacterized protein n=1 Tax=Colletotrichum costaricense TaxID=1209916 RepID=A0AAI9YFH3_9PEZI|nr:uncharacterized protein CCOS01_16418 [Colletotrichum costaricense]KAK1506559.1 hypothetical protein CCOS01_16418 [Colletotrichum costaricense]